MADNDFKDGMSDESRRRVLLALALGRREHGQNCPAPEDILAWNEQLLTGTAADAVQAHVAHCDDCYSLWTGLLSTAAPAVVAPAPWWRRLLSRRPAVQPRGRRLAPVVAGALVAVFAVIGVVNILQLGGPGLPAIPGYELSVQGRAMLRGATGPVVTGPVSLQPGNRFYVVLRPDTTLDEAVAARALILKNGRLESLDAPPPQLLEYGVVVFEGTVGEDVILPEGLSTLVFVSGRAAAMPTSAEILRRMEKQSQFRDNDWVGWRVEVVLE